MSMKVSGKIDKIVQRAKNYGMQIGGNWYNGMGTCKYKEQEEVKELEFHKNAKGYNNTGPEPKAKQAASAPQTVLEYNNGKENAKRDGMLRFNCLNNASAVVAAKISNESTTDDELTIARKIQGLAMIMYNEWQKFAKQ